MDKNSRKGNTLKTTNKSITADKALKARAAFIFAVTAFGTLAIFVRNIALPSGELALYRGILAALLLGTYFIIKREKINFKAMGKEGLMLLLSGTAMGLNWIFLFEAYKYTTVSVATLSYYFAPVIVTILCPILFKEKMTLRQVICFVMATVGVILVINVSGLSGGGKDLIGVVCGLTAAVFYAAVIIVNKFIKNVSGLERTFLQFIVAIIVLMPYVAVTSGFNFMSLDAFGWVNLLIVGLFHTGFVYALYFSSLKEMRGQEVAVLSYIDPLVAVIISVTLLGESMTVMQAAGGVLILGFTLWNEVKSET